MSLAGAALVAILFHPRPAYAYLDPGTGSALVYVVTSVVVSGYFLVRGLYHRALELIFRGRFRGPKHEIVLHSEDRRYESTFLPIIAALAERKIRFSYITMYERDESCRPLPAEASHQAIPAGLVGYSYLNHIEAKFLLTTTPQLDVMMFRRSKRVKHYSYIKHGLDDGRFDRPFACDFYDSIMCCGPVFEANLRRLEERRGLPPKELLHTGLPHYAELVAKAKPHTNAGPKPTVLIAPSWGPMGLLKVFGTDFVKALVDRYHVIIRPHPQTKSSEPEVIDAALAVEGAEVDLAPSPADSIARADIVVSEISGIVFEFAFIHQKPVVVIEHDIGLDALEGYLLKDTPSLLERCAGFIVALKPSEIATLPDRIAETLGRDVAARIAEARATVIFNFDDASSAAARQIEEIVARG